MKTLFLIFLLGFPFSVQSQSQTDEERMIWEETEKEIKRIQTGGVIYQDTTLTIYLNAVLQSLIMENVYPVKPKVNVIMSPVLNAFAYPNGQIYIHSGLLVKMDNEAQLATLLGHEITHSTKKHALQGFRDYRSKADAGVFLGFATAGFGLVGSVVNLMGQVGLMASVYGYSRENESEADLLGYQLIERAGYDVRESASLFKILKKDLELEPPEKESSFFYSTHPKLDDRITSYKKLLNKAVTVGEKIQTDIFREKIRNLTIDNCKLDIKAGRFKSAQHGIDLFKSRYPDDQGILPAQSELNRLIALQKGGVAQSEDRSLKILLESDSLNADALRGLGKQYMKEEKYDSALIYFEKYMVTYPNAKDAGYIKSYIKKCMDKK